MKLQLKQLYDKVVDLSNQKKAKAQEIAALLDKGETEQAFAMRPALDALTQNHQEAVDLYTSMLAASGDNNNPASNFVPANPNKQEKKEITNARASAEYRDAFFAALRSGVTPKMLNDRMGVVGAERFAPLMNVLTETGGAPEGSAGGFLVPVDFDGLLNKLMRQLIDMANYVRTEQVNTLSGWRAFEKSKAMLPLTKMSEDTSMEEQENPKFDRVDYTVDDYGGFLPVTNNLLADAPENLMAYLADWFAQKVVLTNNSLILALITALTPIPVPVNSNALKTIKRVLNKVLDPAISVNSKIFTNQSGFDLLDQMEDGQKRPLLQPNPVSGTSKLLLGREVVLLANRLWPDRAGTGTDDGKTFARLAIGDGTQFAYLFRRQGFEFATTTTGGESWRKNNTEVRGIVRMDVQKRDKEAMALVEVEVTD